MNEDQYSHGSSSSDESSQSSLSSNGILDDVFSYNDNNGTLNGVIALGTVFESSDLLSFLKGRIDNLETRYNQLRKYFTSKNAESCTYYDQVKKLLRKWDIKYKKLLNKVEAIYNNAEHLFSKDRFYSDLSV